MAETKTQIRYYNRLSGKYDYETIYGEGYLRWAYFNPVGKIFLKLLIRNPLFSKFYGWLMNRSSSRKRIISFIEQYKLDVAEFLHSPESFPHFNGFFYRELKADARFVDDNSGSIVFPADGRHLAYEDVQKADTIFAKNQVFDLAGLLGDGGLADELAGGALLISRLCPVDCHRFHAPMEGSATPPRPIHGPLYSVNPLSLAQNLGYLTENRRWVIEMRLDSGQRWAVVVIGATCVGSVEFTYQPGRLEKGSELGYFSMGGSCLVTVVPRGIVKLDEGLVRQSKMGVESYDQMGRVFGQLVG